MRTLRVLNPGLQTTVQDLGRPGLGSMGVPAGGAADTLSLRVGNRLLGNPERSAALECTLVGPEFAFESPALVCLAGAPAPGAVIRGGSPRPLPRWVPTPIEPGERVSIGPIERGARVYVCMAGGVRTPPVLGSRSVHVPSGLAGRPLAVGDVLPIGAPTPGLRVRALDTELAEAIGAVLFRGTLRAVSAPGADGEDTLYDAPYKIEAKSDRTGVRLGRGAWATADAAERVSEGVVPGTVQRPPGGGPIVLGPDGPTVGGYPVLASVVSADLPALGQLRPGETVRFERADRDTAREPAAQLERLVASVPRAAAPPHLLCDTGEAPPGPGREAEMAMLDHVSAVAIACGGHAGDEASMREAVEAALGRGCVMGAHPAYPDRAGFGRVPIQMERAALLGSIASQLASLERVCAQAGAEVAFVKPHGALYHAVSRDPGLARAFARVVLASHPDAALVAAAGSPAIEAWTSMRAEAWPEVFADRAYEPDGSLRDRAVPGAVLTDPAAAAEQAARLAGAARAVCVHGDTPNAPALAGAVRRALTAGGTGRGPGGHTTLG